jgi:hypothetical protein
MRVQEGILQLIVGRRKIHALISLFLSMADHAALPSIFLINEFLRMFGNSEGGTRDRLIADEKWRKAEHRLQPNNSPSRLGAIVPSFL